MGKEGKMKHPIILVCFLSFCISFTSSMNSDGISLLALKAAIEEDPSHALVSWFDGGSTPCNWTGIACDNVHRKVISISLSGKNLTGYIPSEIGALSFLTFLDLSKNYFSGPLPQRVTTLRNLIHLDLSSNSFNGPLPESLSDLTHLKGTLNLSYNSFSGEIPVSFGRFPVTVSLDLGHNNLTGKIPQVGSLLNQGPTAFLGNPYLCGFPSNTPCTEPEAQNPKFLNNPQKPGNSEVSPNGIVQNRKMSRGLVIVSVIAGISFILGIMFAVWLVKKKWKKEEAKLGIEDISLELVGNGEGQKVTFVVLDEGLGLELEDLLRASAYVLGKGRSGIVYKVVVSRGRGLGSGAAGPAVVAVRRLSEGEGDATWRFKEFEAEVETIGRMQHPNIVRLRAYYYASDEKLLVSDYIPNGSLHNALHGPVKTLPPLSWAIRLRIAQEVAKGLMHIHEFSSHRKYIHGNIKSSKILLDGDLKPYISGFGLSRLVPTASRPLHPASRKQNPTQKCDVYSFGVVLLEMLTGRLPDDGGPHHDLEGLVRKVFLEERPLSEIIDPALLHEVHAKKQVVATFHVALNCTEPDLDLRPRMRAVCENLDCIKLQ